MQLCQTVLDHATPGDETRAALRARWLLDFAKVQLNVASPSRSSSLVQTRANAAVVALESDRVDAKDFVILGMIGQGQFGKMYLAKKDDDFVVVKFVQVGLILQNRTDVTNNILQERLCCRILTSHKIANVVRYIGLVEDTTKRDQRGLVFELCADVSNIPSHPREFPLESEYFDMDNVPDWFDLVVSSLRECRRFRFRVQIVRKKNLEHVETSGKSNSRDSSAWICTP